MPDTSDPSWKLRAPSPTPDDELCSCSGSQPITLQAHLSPNPLSCIDCNLEVSPESVGFSEALAERLAFWQSFHDCFYLLWLDSGEFESWARKQLEDAGSPVNQRGLELVSELNTFRRTYYWWFQDTGAEDFQTISQCPTCQAHLAARHGRSLCDQCSIVVGN